MSWNLLPSEGVFRFLMLRAILFSVIILLVLLFISFIYFSLAWSRFRFFMNATGTLGILMQLFLNSVSCCLNSAAL